MFGLMIRWCTAATPASRKPSGAKLSFRGHFERLETRSVLSAAFGSPHVNLPLAVSPDFASDEPSHEVVSHESTRITANRFPGSLPNDVPDGQGYLSERRDNTGAGAVIGVGLHIVRAPVPTAPSQAFEGGDSTTIASESVTFVASNAQRAPVVAVTAPQAFAAAETRFVTPSLVGLLVPEAISTSFGDVVDIGEVDRDAFLPREWYLVNEPLTPGYRSDEAKFNALGSDQQDHFDSDDDESAKTDFRLFRDRSHPLDAFQREQVAVDEVLASLFDVADWRHEPSQTTDNQQNGLASIDAPNRTEMADDTDTDRRESALRPEPADGGMVLLLAEGDPNLDAHDLVAVISGLSEDQFERQSGTPLSVGTHLKLELGGQPPKLQNRAASLTPPPALPETRTSSASKQESVRSQSS